MSNSDTVKRSPLEGAQVMSAVATGGGGGVFQARVGVLYLANMLTGLPTAVGLHGARVELLRFEARYTGAHTDDIYCQLRDNEGSRLQLVQCKLGLDATPGNSAFVDGLQGAWRDFLGLEGSPFDCACDVLVLATAAPATPANRASKRLCELSRASVDLADFLQKLESKGFNAQHRRTWSAFKEVSKSTLAEKYTDELVFDLLRRLRIDVHDLESETSQEISLVQALLNSGTPGDSGEQVWNGLLGYVLEQGIAVGTVTRERWKATALAGLQDAVRRVDGSRGLGSIAARLSDRASYQLSLISTRLPNGTHIPRGQCAAQILSGFDDRQLVVVTGGPGAGKSAVISDLAPLLQESGPLFFFRADELDQPSLAAVQSLSNLPDPVLSWASLLSSGTPTVVIDSLEKALEASNPGALEELLVLVRRNRGIRLCVTTRAYALNALYAIFLYDFSYQVVDVPPLTTAEIFAAVAGTALEATAAKDGGVLEVLRAPYYLQLAFNYTAAGAALPQASGNDLRLKLWTERIAPSKGLPPGLAARRRSAFDEACYTRTERFAQFVEAPGDAEAVASLVQDAVLAKDATERVAPAHDVLEDWSLFFRVEREARTAERDWGPLFARLGSHAGMRRALRAWTAQRSAEGDEDAYALLEAALAQDASIPQLWRDEVAIGLLRSERVDDLVARLDGTISFASAGLLQRLSHLLRVACKGPTSIDYSCLANEKGGKEIALRLGMAAPVGKAWDVLIGLVAKAFASLSSKNHAWVVQLAEDATAHNPSWHKPTQRTLDVFGIAERVCRQDTDAWHRDESVGKRFFALLCSNLGADTERFEAFMQPLLRRLAGDPDSPRDFHAEERLQFLVGFKHCREASFFVPDLVWQVFWALYVESGADADAESESESELLHRHRFDMGGREARLGLGERAARAFFPPSAMQGPFRLLLMHALAKSVHRIVDLCNHAAASLAKVSEEGDVLIIPPVQSPNGRPHIHSYALWTAYRGHAVTSYLLNCALMALEECLLLDAKAHPAFVSQVLEIILARGESSFTTGLIAGVLTAHPELANEALLALFKCPQFFFDDITRSGHEAAALAIHGGHDGLDEARQQERMASNRLAHRHHHLEMLVLQLQLQRAELCEPIHRILDTHLEALKGADEVPDGWRIALKRMDVRGLKLGEPVDGGNRVPLEIADLEPELRQASDEAELRLRRMNRVSALRTWAGAVTGRFTTANPEIADRFSSPAEVVEELARLEEEFGDEEIGMFVGLEVELPCAMVLKWPTDTSENVQWARELLLEQASVRGDNDAWLRRDPSLGELLARTVIVLAAVDPALPKMVDALVNIVTEPVWKIRWAAARAIAVDLRPQQPVLAEVLTTGLAQYADALDVRMGRPRSHPFAFVDEARSATAEVLGEALRQLKPGVRPSPSGLAAVKEWLIAIGASRGEVPQTWRVQSLAKLAELVADQERGPRGCRHDHDEVDFEAHWELADLLAEELMSQPDESSALFKTFECCLKHAPKLSARLLETALVSSAKQRFANAPALWRIWDRATAKMFPESSLRTKSRRVSSIYSEVLSTLLLCSVPWEKGFHDLELLKSRPRFIVDCLAAVGDSRAAMEHLLQLMAGVGRVSSVPSALPQLRDALLKAPADLLDDFNSLWHAETICRVAVHDQREALIRDIRLRKATLDILDRLVDAGSSLGFQLRDYLAATPTVSKQ